MIEVKWPQRGDVYSHYKGDRYVVHAVVINEDGYRCVAYGPVSEFHSDVGPRYVQSAARFTQTVECVSRFEYEGRNLL